jgi:gamma-glutamyltranspeptidase / glutathione hydrolase
MKTISLALLAVMVSFSAARAADRPVGRSFTTRSEIIAQHGIAATSQPLATQAALDILKQGGSAVDAAVAADALLGLVEPVSCGVGGDLFAIVWDASAKKLHGLNASGRSPYSLSLDHLKALGLTHIPSTGPLPVTVPGCVDGWFELHAKFGKLPMATLLAPAIRYANEGFPLTEIIAEDWQRGAAALQKWPGFKEIFMPGGQAPRKGQIFRNPALAKTLGAIAASGRDAFYRGAIAKTIAEYMRRNGGFLSEQDLADHHSEWVQPVSTSYRGYEVWELPPNTQGIAVLQMLNLLEGYDVKQLGFGSPEYLHLFVEAKKLVFEDRARFYADPAFQQLPVQQLISKSYAAERRQLIDSHRAARRYDAGQPALKTGDTIYLTVADEAGNMVSLIQSNFRGLGSGMTPDGLGFVLQDRGELFSLREGEPNTYAPHKRPFHTIIPAFVTRAGQPWLSFGVMGGDMQPQGHVQILVNLIDFGMNLQEAGDAPRVQHVGSSDPTGSKMSDGGTVYLESGFFPEAVRGLLHRGHKVAATVGSFGGYQAILFDASNHVYYGASESRKDGQAAGY